MLILTFFSLLYHACICAHDVTEDDDVFKPNSAHVNSLKLASASAATSTRLLPVTADGHIDTTATLEIDPEKAVEDIPLIIWWTGRIHILNGIKEIACPKSVCYLTKRRKYVKDKRTRAFLFYGSDLKPDDLPIPRYRKHEWALFHEESPLNNYMLSHGLMLKLFNHTATFRRESDFPLSSQNIYSLDYLTKRPPVSLKAKYAFRQKGYAPILFVQSHCNVASDRDRYVKELMNYIDVDSYGKCVNNKNIPEDLSDPVKSMESDTFLDFIAQYKFHLAFENALCKDYMTEKLFRPLHVGSVPIHRGSPAAKDWMPDNQSLILVDDFPSPKELAEYIKYLDTHDEEYEKYLQFKHDGITNKFLLDHMRNRYWGKNDFNLPNHIESFECHVCDELTARIQREKEHVQDSSVSLVPEKMAERNHLGCAQPYTAIGHPDDVPDDDGWKVFDWIEDYWSSFDKVLAIRTMLQVKETNSSKFDEYWTQVVKKRNRNL